ncbi:MULTISPECIES: helix-turn-helix domain-containing protein [Microbacterium]|uniref:winged helix-turn-helix domain-containing protein n=1 Tax=Microbacterium TaxID=33882 RepID=UPI0019ACD13B|nr:MULTISPECIES: helix-turn-helix domain-containing protein [Microbacterium]MBD3756548.1 helix-turn-helix transcriptional regulator [Microbacterium sp.]
MTDDENGSHGARGVSADRMLDAGALRALAHPLRVEMYDILSQYGPQTASTLATMTGESSGATSYHLRALAKHDLIREVEGRGSARERWWERPRGPVSFTNPEAMRTPSGKAATQVVMREFLNRRHDQLMRFVSEQLVTPESLDDSEAMISTTTLVLTPEQVEELTDALQEVVTTFVERYRDQETEGTRRFSVRTDVFPLPPEGGAS